MTPRSGVSRVAVGTVVGGFLGRVRQSLGCDHSVKSRRVICAVVTEYSCHIIDVGSFLRLKESVGI